MKFSAVCLSSLLAPATALSLFNSDSQRAIVAGDDDHKIPGDSPLELCPGDHADDLITINSVNLAPNPPLAYVMSITSKLATSYPIVTRFRWRSMDGS